MSSMARRILGGATLGTSSIRCPLTSIVLWPISGKSCVTENSFHRLLLWQHPFEDLSKLGYVPLLIPQTVQKPAHGVGLCDMEPEQKVQFASRTFNSASSTSRQVGILSIILFQIVFVCFRRSMSGSTRPRPRFDCPPSGRVDFEGTPVTLCVAAPRAGLESEW